MPIIRPMFKPFTTKMYSEKRARENEPTRAISIARHIYSLKGLLQPSTTETSKYLPVFRIQLDLNKLNLRSTLHTELCLAKLYYIFYELLGDCFQFHISKSNNFIIGYILLFFITLKELTEKYTIGKVIGT